MINMKKISLLMITSGLLIACNDTTETETVSQLVAVSESSQVIESLPESISEEMQEESLSTPTEESLEESSDEMFSESSQESSEEVTQLNSEEAALIERGKMTITEMTGYSEEDYLFLIHPVEEQVVTIEVREDGEEVASMIGMFRYNDETRELQEMDLLTGEYVTYPAE